MWDGGTVLDPSEYDDVLVRVMHPWGDVDVPLTAWIGRGPGPRAVVRRPPAARAATGAPGARSGLPLEDHDCDHD